MNIQLIITSVILSIILTGCLSISKGEKIGNIYKISKDGIICPTNEAELIGGGFNGGNGSFGKEFNFTIEDKRLLETAKYAMENNKEVKIHYHQEAITICRSHNNDNFVDSIEIIDKN